MVKLEDFLNIQNSTRKLTEEEFRAALPELAKQLESFDYHFNYTKEELLKDWDKLQKYNNSDNFTASQTRPGVKLCEQFFPNLFDIENSKGQSFSKLWAAKNLEKILVWNRSSHSTPYISELRRGVYFTLGLTKNTMYRPHLTKMICDHYKPKVVLDPCMGWGGRMLGVIASGAKYIGFDPNEETYNNLVRLAKFLDIEDKVILIKRGAEFMDEYDFGKVDLVLTSPPYFNLEIYSKSSEQAENKYDNYKNWRDLWLKDVIKKSISKLNDGGVSCWNVHNIGKMKMIDDIQDIHKELGFTYNSVYGLSSSARQANQTEMKNKKTQDLTVCYKSAA